jgi:N-acetylglucosamine kinase-like BadF-type ATPase
MKWFLGVDGGQSGTTALIADEHGCVLAEGRAGPCNHVDGTGGRERFITAVRGSLDEALRALGTPAPRFSAACFGFSGGPADKDALARELVQAETYCITHDAEIALTGATAGEPGVIAIAGTGSIAFGRNAAGKTARAGGWGYLFGDEGGAFDMVRQALRASLREEEGWGPQTALRAALLEATGARDANDLLHLFYTAAYPRARVAALAKIVDTAARSGDAVARDIMNGAAQSLATLVAVVRHQLFPAGEAVRVSYAGGVFSSNLLLERYRMLVELEEGATVSAPLHGPAQGALLEAYRLAGMNAKQREAICSNLSRTSSTRIA